MAFCSLGKCWPLCELRGGHASVWFLIQQDSTKMLTSYKTISSREQGTTCTAHHCILVA